MPRRKNGNVLLIRDTRWTHSTFVFDAPRAWSRCGLCVTPPARRSIATADPADARPIAQRSSGYCTSLRNAGSLCSASKFRFLGNWRLLVGFSSIALRSASIASALRPARR